jgi:hypothetical protein
MRITAPTLAIGDWATRRRYSVCSIRPLRVRDTTRRSCRLVYRDGTVDRYRRRSAYAAITDKSPPKLVWLFGKWTNQELSLHANHRRPFIQRRLYLWRRIHVGSRRRPKHDCLLARNAQRHPDIRGHLCRSVHGIAQTSDCRICAYASLGGCVGAGSRPGERQNNQGGRCAS